MADKDKRDYLEMAFRSIECFSNDGKLLPAELKRLLDIALRDGVVDANEKRVLRNILGKLKPDELTAEMRQSVADLRVQAGI